MMLLVNARVGVSKIHGLGLVAKEFIPCGTLIWKFHAGFDIEISESCLNDLSASAREQVLHYAEYFPEEKKFILSSDDDRFTNHSDNPNTADHRNEVFAARDICPGEEITCDYRRVIVLGSRP
jgi:uncharacterized protein